MLILSWETSESGGSQLSRDIKHKPRLTANAYTRNDQFVNADCHDGAQSASILVLMVRTQGGTRYPTIMYRVQTAQRLGLNC